MSCSYQNGYIFQIFFHFRPPSGIATAYLHLYCTAEFGLHRFFLRKTSLCKKKTIYKILVKKRRIFISSFNTEITDNNSKTLGTGKSDYKSDYNSCAEDWNRNSYTSTRKKIIGCSNHWNLKFQIKTKVDSFAMLQVSIISSNKY